MSIPTLSSLNLRQSFVLIFVHTSVILDSMVRILNVKQFVASQPAVCVIMLMSIGHSLTVSPAQPILMCITSNNASKSGAPVFDEQMLNCIQRYVSY